MKLAEARGPRGTFSGAVAENCGSHRLL